jgi:hypothetical protein
MIKTISWAIQVLLLTACLRTGSTELHASSAPQETGGASARERYRVIISTDIGGADPDDVQSLVHYLLYADLFETEGLISSPPGAGRAAAILTVLDAYARDYPSLHAASATYPTPDQLRGIVRQGAADPAPIAGFSQPTPGSRQIIERAHAPDTRPVWVLAWGGLSDVAQAAHDDPSIKPKLRIYSIGAWNTQQDPHARRYLFEHHPDLWWIESNSTFRGMYVGGNQSGELGNLAFVEKNLRSRGALGACFWSAKPDIKMGDTPSVLYLLHGTPSDPTRPSWGGQFVPAAGRAHYWTDDPNPAFASETYAGARHINQWREAYLDSWKRTLSALSTSMPGAEK